MSDKVKIPQKVANAIESVWELSDKEFKVSTTKHMLLTNWDWLISTYDEEKIGNTLFYFAQKHPITYMRALVKGYEIEDEKYIVDIYMLDGGFIPKCTVYKVEETNNAVTNKNGIDSLFQKMPWGNEVRQFGIRSKYIQSLISPDMVERYVLVKID